MSPRLSVTIALVALCLFTAASYAGAANFRIEAKPGSGPGIWDYELFNDSNPADALVITGIDLDWPEDVIRPEFTIANTPDGWTSLIYEWPAWDATSTNEPSAGASLPGFSVSTTEKPTVFVVYYDQLGVPGQEFGDVQFVPEPGSLVVMLSSLAGLGLTARRRRA